MPQRKSGRRPGGARPNRKTVLGIFKKSRGRSHSLSDITRAMELPSADRRKIRTLIDDLVAEGTLEKLSGGKYAIASKKGKAEGILKVYGAGFGFVINEDGPDVFVPISAMSSALHGDRVEVETQQAAGKTSPEGKVVRIIERSNDLIIGQFVMRGAIGFVEPSDERIKLNIRANADCGASPGDLVSVSLESYPTGGAPAVGKIVKRIGKAGDPHAEVLAIALAAGIEPEFPAPVLAEAEKLSPPSDKNYPDRTDLRSEIIVTIDGADARDFDDAIGVTLLPDGWRLTVSIADVSHYVRPGTALDADAKARSVSSYFPNMVIPMLPEKLSNDLCSLREGVDRMALTAEIRFNKTGLPVDSKFYPSVIKSRRRCTYEEVDRLLEGKSVKGLSGDVAEMLEQAIKLSELIRMRRTDRGSIDMDLPEAAIELDPTGCVISFTKRDRLESHRLIEDFMIAANESVAEKLSAAEAALLYRIHEPPDEAALADLVRALDAFGIKIAADRPPTSREVADILRNVIDKPFSRTVTELTLRSLKRAQYGPVNLGHFGLASRKYCHFTSPIRRYPDLVVHRALRNALNPNDEAGVKYATEQLVETGAYCSDKERKSESAERNSTKFFAALCMADKIGEQHIGIISSVTDFGFFVEPIEIFIEGLVRVADLPDWYAFDPDRRSLRGEKSGASFRIGDYVLVEIASVNISARRIDFKLLEGPLSRARLKKLNKDL